MKILKIFIFALLIALLAGLTSCTSPTDSQENQSAENPATPAPENPDTPDPENPVIDDGEDDSEEEPPFTDPEIAVCDATLTTDELETFDYASFGNLSLSVPLDSTSVDVWKLFEAMQTLKEKAEAQTALDGVPRVVTFAAYPASVTTFVIKNNLELMAKAGEPDYSDAQVGDNFYKDLVPGIQVQSHVAVIYNSGTKNIQKALKFSDTTKKVDLSKTGYDLTDTYQGGIIGGGDFVNLANTTIDGTIDGRSNISPFYEKFIKNTDVENLPDLDLTVRKFDEDEANLYGTNIDLVIAKYFNNSKTMNFTNKVGGFDAKEYLKEGSMYEGNSYSEKAYNLDINAALVMNTDTSNVNITGVKSSSAPTELSVSLTNVRFESDLNGVSLTGSQRGVIEFAGDAPDYIDEFGSRLVYSSVSRETRMNGAHSVDVSKLSVSAAANIKAVGTSDGITEVITNSEGAKPSNFSITRTVTSGTYSAQQWEKAGNQGKENPSEADLSYVLPSKNINQTKSDLIRAGFIITTSARERSVGQKHFICGCRVSGILYSYYTTNNV